MASFLLGVPACRNPRTKTPQLTIVLGRPFTRDAQYHRTTVGHLIPIAESISTITVPEAFSRKFGGSGTAEAACYGCTSGSGVRARFFLFRFEHGHWLRLGLALVALHGLDLVFLGRDLVFFGLDLVGEPGLHFRYLLFKRLE